MKLAYKMIDKHAIQLRKMVHAPECTGLIAWQDEPTWERCPKTCSCADTRDLSESLGTVTALLWETAGLIVEFTECCGYIEDSITDLDGVRWDSVGDKYELDDIHENLDCVKEYSEDMDKSINGLYLFMEVLDYHRRGNKMQQKAYQIMDTCLNRMDNQMHKVNRWVKKNLESYTANAKKAEARIQEDNS